MWCILRSKMWFALCKVAGPCVTFGPILIALGPNDSWRRLGAFLLSIGLTILFVQQRKEIEELRAALAAEPKPVATKE